MEKSNKKILIVEDDKDFSFILQTKFKAEGFDVVLAENGEEGIAMVEKENPDLIISDVLIPKMDGIEMAKKIREINKNVLILFLTNMKDEECNEDYIIKSDVKISDIVEKAKTKLGIK